MGLSESIKRIMKLILFELDINIREIELLNSLGV